MGPLAHVDTELYPIRSRILVFVSNKRQRPTRDETKEQLFRAATEVFVEKGIAGASIEEICRAAGLTRGAVYSNFANKDELVMAMLDDHVDRTIAELERLLPLSASTEEYLTLIDTGDRSHISAMAATSMLRMEFLLYALRNPVNRPKLVARQRRFHAFVSEIVRRDDARYGPSSIPVEDVGGFICALDDGYSLHQLIDPEGFVPGAFSRNLIAIGKLAGRIDQSELMASTAATPKSATLRPAKPRPAKLKAGKVTQTVAPVKQSKRHR